MRKLISLVILNLISTLLAAQQINLSIPKIDSIVKQIDSTCISGGITDFIIKKKGKKKVIGGGADWYYTDSLRKKLLKANRELSLESDNLDSYYFFEDSLIYIKTRKFIYVADKTTVKKEATYYFNNGSLIFKEGDFTHALSIDNLLKISRSLLLDFKKLY